MSSQNNDENKTGRQVVKNILSKIKNLGIAINRETVETKKAAQILVRIINGKEVTSEQVAFLKEQSADIAKVLALVGLQAIPGSSVAIVALEKFGAKYGFSLLPKDQNEPNIDMPKKES